MIDLLIFFLFFFFLLLISLKIKTNDKKQNKHKTDDNSNPGRYFEAEMEAAKKMSEAPIDQQIGHLASMFEIPYDAAKMAVEINGYVFVLG